ncbi:MAG: hypothetical protein OES24_02890 [Acidimicrobiia bacterium]|nr:hypothetical protein [Acidimicrobiia bacterium]
MGYSVLDRQTTRHPLAVDRSHKTLGVGLLVLAGALAVNSALGPLLLDVIDYPVSETMRNQTIGLDAANLLLVAPLCAFVGRLALHRNRWAPLLALGPTTYTAYMFVQYIAGPDHATYVRALPLQLLAFVLGWMLAVLAWRTRPGPVRSSIDRRLHAMVAGLFAGFVVLRYLAGLAGTITEESLPAELQTDLAMYWLIFLLDLGVFVPVAVAIAIGLWRGSEWAMPALAGLVGWYLLVTAAVGAMSVTMVVNGDRYASNGLPVLLAAVTVAVSAYAVVLAESVPVESPSRINGSRP